MASIKAHTLREKNKDELLKQVEELRKELANLRIAKVTGGAANKVSKMFESTSTKSYFSCRNSDIHFSI